MTVPNELINPSHFDLLNGLKKDDMLHRYCSLAEFNCLLDGKLSLTCPFNWTENDPFEHPLFRAKLIGKNGKPHDISQWGRQFHCQSWTLITESDTMWRLYGQNAAGVRISTRAADLLFQAYNSHSLREHKEYLKVKLGIVTYLPEDDLKQKLIDEFRSMISADSMDDGILESLFFKRQAYHLESEVRLVANDASNLGDQTSGRLLAPLVNFNWITEVLFGPAMKIEDFAYYKHKLIKLGIPSEKIRKSNLYGDLVYDIDLSI